MAETRTPARLDARYGRQRRSRALVPGVAAAAAGVLALTAWAVWTGIGTVGTAILGMVLFGDPATALRLACIGLIVAGILGLKLVS